MDEEPSSGRTIVRGALPKRCSCGLVYDEVAWSTLRYCGLMLGIDDVPDLEMRHCVCGSTLAVELEGRTGSSTHARTRP